MVELITQFIHELVMIGDCQQANLITLVRELSTCGLDDDQLTTEMKQEYDEQILHFHEYIQVRKRFEIIYIFVSAFTGIVYSY